MRALQDMGASKAASRLAFRAIRNRPWDRQIWKEAGPNSPFSILYRGSRKVYRAIKRFTGKPPRAAEKPARLSVCPTRGGNG